MGRASARESPGSRIPNEELGQILRRMSRAELALITIANTMSDVLIVLRACDKARVIPAIPDVGRHMKITPRVSDQPQVHRLGNLSGKRQVAQWPVDRPYERELFGRPGWLRLHVVNNPNSCGSIREHPQRSLARIPSHAEVANAG